MVHSIELLPNILRQEEDRAVPEVIPRATRGRYRQIPCVTRLDIMINMCSFSVSSQNPTCLLPQHICSPYYKYVSINNPE